MLDSLAAIPIVLLVVFKLTLRFLPLFIALMGFDQLAGEVGPKSIRYLVVRAKRSSMILGKLLSQVTLFDLLHPHWGRFLTAALVHVGFGLTFLGLAQLALRKRDL